MKSFLQGYTKITSKICYYMSFISMLMIMFILAIMTIDVVLNLICKIRILGAYELATSALVLVVFSSWAYTQSEHGHIHVVLFIKMMPKKVRHFLFGLTSWISLAVMIIGGYAVFFSLMAKKSAGESTANLMIPIWPLVLIEFIAFVLLAVVMLKDCIASVYALFDEETADSIETHWV